MREAGIKEMTVHEAKIVKKTGFFYCHYFNEVGEVGVGCGKDCKAYSPRNGKSGRCRYSSHTYERTDKTKTIILWN